MARKMKFQTPMPEGADPECRARVYLERANGNRERAMDEAAAHGDRAAMEVLTR